MMEILYILAGIGITFNLIGAIGIIRFPDVYTRLHAATLCTTFGTIFLGATVVLYSLLNWGAASNVMAFHTIVAILALLVTNPTAAHAIARASHRAGILPKNAVVDQYRSVKK